MKVPDAVTIRTQLVRRREAIESDWAEWQTAKCDAALRADECHSAWKRVEALIHMNDAELAAMVDEIATAVNQAELIDGITAAFK